ncbi:MAG: septal ring lytic transglycosylase RlpA family protein [Bradyrhizobium sp.]|nr:septal ring lytic transglycosylase RlpA family protein [Bradyrhizobium sp.]
MKANIRLAAGRLARSNTALAIFAATLVIGGTASEASARSRHHYRGHYFHHLSRASESARGNSWRDANAAIAPAAGTGHSFSGIASMYGNESGHHTASGQRFNENAMTCAHRSLPFGTRLRVTHGDRSVVVTVNDRGPFVRGRVLDLSTGAAHAIGLSGIGQVTAEIVG